MRRRLYTLSLSIIFGLGFGCAAPRSNTTTATGGNAAGGQTTGTGGGAGGVTTTGGTTSSGGISGSGGVGGASGGTAGGGSGGATNSGGTTGSGGSAAGGATGSGGSAPGDAAGDARPDSAGDSAGDARPGSGGAAGGGAGAGGATMAGGRTGSGGSTTTAAGGRTGTGGTTSAGGTMSTGGSTAPTPCSFPSSWAPGSATYTTYTLPNAQTACGYNGSNNTIKNIANGGNFAAIPGNTSSDFNTKDRCGACVQIGSAVITIVDECPNDSNAPCKANPSGHLDLSQAGASAGGVQGDPNKKGQNQWKFVPCPVSGNVMVRLKPGNNNEMYIENEIMPIAQVTCGGQTGSRTSYGAWHFSGNIPGADCTVTDIANRTISVKAGSTQGQDVDTGVQFPKCQ
jgi:hypothetical protein